MDGFAWMALRVGARRSELLEVLTASGSFDNPQVCMYMYVYMHMYSRRAAASTTRRCARELVSKETCQLVWPDLT